METARNCSNGSLQEIYENYEETDNNLILVNCSLPNETYAEFLDAICVNVTFIQSLQLYRVDKHTKPIQPNILEGLTNLRHLKIYYSEQVFPQLPSTTSVEIVELWDGASVGHWGGCNELRELHLRFWDIENVEDSWLAHCPHLHTLNFKAVKSRMWNVLAKALSGIRELRKVIFTNSNIDDLSKASGFLADAGRLEELDLSSNQLFYFYAQPTWRLIKLDLGYNKLHSSANQILSEQKDLLYLNIGHNKRLHFCRDDPYKSIGNIISHKKLKVLDLSGTATNSLCFEQFESLEYLDLNDCDITEFKFSAVPVSHAPQLTVNLKKNPLESLTFDQNDYFMLVDNAYSLSKLNKTTEDFERGVVVVLATLQVDCDCEVGWLVRALYKDMALNISDLSCRDGSQLENSTSMECMKWTCVGGCVCRRYWDSDEVDIDCSSAHLDAIPIPLTPGLRVVMASNNLIRVINAKELPDSVTWLDVSSNRISLVDASTTTALFSVSERQMMLAGNPILCNCENQQFIEQLHLHSDQVIDYAELLCAEDGKSVADIATDLLCIEESHLQFWVMAGIGSLVLLVALAALAAAVYCRYERELCVFLYARGCCLPCVREEELDADRSYDAFVSFSHGDEQYVMEELVPGLERAPHSYRVCVHYRDWVPGEFIPLQISRSVEQSRRTIIVMSKNYLISMWGLLEFRTAHEDTLKSRRPRIVVILLDDVSKEDGLDAELRAYLHNNTYVKHRDPWFWEKLRYAMPHRDCNIIANINTARESTAPVKPSLQIAS